MVTPNISTRNRYHNIIIIINILYFVMVLMIIRLYGEVEAKEEGVIVNDHSSP